MRALERFLSSVFAEVTREFIAARESPRASVPRAFVGFLPRVGPLVGLQVRALCVHLLTPTVIALVDALARVIHWRAPHSQAVVRLGCG